MNEINERSPGQLFIDEFVDRNLVEFDDCCAYYERLTPDELVQELSFLFSKQVMCIRFELIAKRFRALLVSLIHCAANARNLTDRARSGLVDMIIDLRDFLRERTSTDRQEAFDKAMTATLDRARKFGLFPLVSDLIANGVRDYKGEFPTSVVGEVLAKR